MVSVSQVQPAAAQAWINQYASAADWDTGSSLASTAHTVPPNSGPHYGLFADEGGLTVG
jgi:hypothetical protein